VIRLDDTPVQALSGRFLHGAVGKRA